MHDLRHELGNTGRIGRELPAAYENGQMRLTCEMRAIAYTLERKRVDHSAGIVWRGRPNSRTEDDDRIGLSDFSVGTLNESNEPTGRDRQTQEP
jgi:hypothetical protein